MKRGLKKLLAIILIFILAIGIFYCAKKALIRNIFDEMYFGTKDIWGGRLTSASWNNMSGLAKTVDDVKYAVPNTICIGFSDPMLADDENLQVIWEMDKKRILFVYSVSLPRSESHEEMVLDVCYSPRHKNLEIGPLRVASSNNIYGDTARETIDEFFRRYGASEEAFYARVTEVFEAALIENWRTGNPATLFQNTLGEFEIVYEEENESASRMAFMAAMLQQKARK